MQNNMSHWADKMATKISFVKKKDKLRVASGITPSGTVHIGNFREVITVDFVRRALLQQKKQVDFLLFWDDYDVFRKVPDNMPNKDELKKFIGMPLTNIPSPFQKELQNDKKEKISYARFHEMEVEKLLYLLGIKVQYIYQAEKYQSGFYKDEIKKTLQNKDEIKQILNQYRQQKLEDDWLPINVYCEKCNYQQIKINKIQNNKIAYTCLKCNFKDEFNHQEKFITKLLWRIDWPMRWFKMNIDFEPGGKDHATQGGSYDTAKQIVQKVFNASPPVFLQYDFLRIKGKGGKISSSEGNVITLKNVLEVYEPEIVRWIFASYQPNVEFVISFDLDVLNVYDRYDRAERIYFDIEETSPNKIDNIKRAYQLSQISTDFDSVATSPPYRISFRHLANLLQINELEEKKTYRSYQAKLANAEDEKKFKNRLACVKNWLQKYAPEDFIFQVNQEKKDVKGFNYSKSYLDALADFRLHLQNHPTNTLHEKILNEQIYELIKQYKLDGKVFFALFYQLLIGREQGPRLINFMVNLGKDKILKLI